MLTAAAARILAQDLRGIRHVKDLTLREVAARAGLSPQYVHNIERSERLNTTPGAYEKLARGYMVPAKWVARATPEPVALESGGG